MISKKGIKDGLLRISNIDIEKTLKHNSKPISLVLTTDNKLHEIEDLNWLR